MPEDEFTIARRQREARDAQQSAIQGLDGNKDEAAHAVDIASKTGADAEYVYSHYPSATRAYRSNLVQDAVADDDMVKTYFNNHPLAPVVSKDDVSNLVTFSDAFKGLKHWTAVPQIVLQAAQLIKSAEAEPNSSLGVAARYAAHTVPTIITGIGVGALAGGAAVPLVGTVPGAIIGAGAGLLGGAAEGLAQSWLTQQVWPEEAERLQRGEEAHPYAALAGEAAAGALFFTPGPLLGKALIPTLPTRALMAGVMSGVTGAEELVSKGEIEPRDVIAAGIGAALFAGKPTSMGNLLTSGRFMVNHIKNGEYPPAGVWRPWDEVVVGDTKAGMGQYDEVMKAAGKSETRELSPEMWKKYVNDQTPIGLKWDFLSKIYPEGKRPEPGDGLLGDVPGIEEKWNRSQFSKEDLKISFDEWSKVDKKVEDALHDDLRLRPDLYTLNETKELPPAKEPIPVADETQQTINDTRTASGLDPLFVENIGEEPLTLKPGIMMTARQQERMVKEIADINKEDVKRRTAVEKKKAERKLLPEYTRRGAEIHEKVSNDTENSPGFKGWRFMNNGEFNGQKMPGIPKIDPRFLSAEQREKFPEHWTSSRGLNPDEVGPELGFKNGNDFIDGMIKFREQKGPQTYEQFKANAIQAEAANRLKAEFGDLDAFTTQQARNHVIGLKAEDYMWFEYRTLGDILGLKPEHDRAAVKAMAAEAVARMPHDEATVMQYTRELGRAAAKANTAWLKGDVLGAFHARQETVHKLAMANEARLFEQRKKADARILKPLGRVAPTGMDPEHTDWAHYIMLKHGVPTQRDVDHLWETIGRPERQYKTLEDFANSRNVPVDPKDPAKVGLPLGYQDSATSYNPNMPIWDQLLDPQFRKPVWEMDVREYKALTASLRVLLKMGREKGENTLMIRDKEFKIADLLPKFLAPIETFGEAAKPKTEIGKKIALGWRTASAYVKTPENFLLRMARYDESGVWLTHFFDPANEAYTAFTRAQKEFSRHWRQAWDPITKKYGINKEWWGKESNNKDTFYHPRYWSKDADGKDRIPGNGKDWITLNNESLVAIAANMGSEDSIRHLAAGYHITVDQLKWFAQRELKPEHYELAEAASTVYRRLQELEDDMTMQRSGTVLEKIQPGRVWTPFGDRPGWYWPRRRDVDLDGGRQKIDPHPVPNRIQTKMGWTEARTGAIYPVQLNMQTMQHDITDRLRHIHIQPVLDIWNKLLSHSDIQNAIYRKFGDQYNQMLKDLFNDMAANRSPPEGLYLAFNKAMNFYSNRGLTSVIGYNFGTIIKHAPQSILQSFTDDPAGILKAAYQLTMNRIVRDRNIDFMRNGGMVGNLEFKGSGELANRTRYFKDDLSETSAELLGKDTLAKKVDRANVRAGMSMLSWVDSTMSELTWLARYNREMDTRMAKLNERSGKMTPQEYNQALADEHVEANARAERAVRQTHGSTAITAKPALLRQQDPMTNSMTRAMNFMNNVLQRRYRMMFALKDMALGQSNRDVMTDIRQITRDFMVYFLLPTFLEDLADPICKTEDSGPTCGAKYLAQGLAAPLPVVRDMVHGMISEGDSSFGFVWNGARYLKQVGHDLSKFPDDDMDYGKFIQHSADFMGFIRGSPYGKPARWAKYLYNMQPGGEEHAPQDLEETMNVLRWGQTQPMKHEEKRQRLIPRLMGE